MTSASSAEVRQSISQAGQGRRQNRLVGYQETAGMYALLVMQFPDPDLITQLQNRDLPLVYLQERIQRDPGGAVLVELGIIP